LVASSRALAPFDAETIRIMGLAFETTCIALRIGDCADNVRQAIAAKVIDLARKGEHNPDVLCEVVLQQIRIGPDSQVA
jgi:hypothetical protein